VTDREPTSVECRTWRTPDEIAALFQSPTGPDHANDRDLIDQTPRDPWATT